MPNQKGSDSDKRARLEQFRSVIHERAIRIVYQPIVSLADGSVFGFEALARGPENSGFQSPLELFHFAEQEGMLFALDRLAREQAIAGCGRLDRKQRIFINIPGKVIHDPRFTPGQTLKLLEAHGMSPQNVVFEITERSSIEDFTTAKRILQHYRSQGYQIAIDDAGAGYSSLQAIAELHPDFIKVDQSLIRNIHQDVIKEYILETFVAFAEKMKIRMIAEGIEQQEELHKLIRMGVHYGQGYLLARPSPHMEAIDERMSWQIASRRKTLGANELHSIGQIAMPAKTFGPGTPISEVVSYFRRNENELGTVIVSQGVPVGLVMRDKLYRELAEQYGIPLFWNRPVSKLMDSAPLVVDEHVTLDRASQMATSRQSHHLYDLVLITSGGRYMGVASIRTILESITNVRVERAKVANPLTGLPGNQQIYKELNKRIADQHDYSVLYVDLNCFKWFNDRYGFHRGDELIQFTADILQEASVLCGLPDDFVGHIGGDDFILITNSTVPQKLCEEIIRRFDAGVEAFFNPHEPVMAVNRDGVPMKTDRVSVSLSLIICDHRTPSTAEFISQEAAKLKKRSKAYPGSAYASKQL